MTDTSSEQHRHECEVRYVAGHESKWIRWYLEGVKKERGESAYLKLRVDVLIEWNKLKDASNKTKAQP